MNEALLHALSKAEIEAIEAADLWAANDEIFDQEDFLEEPAPVLESSANEEANCF